MVIEQRKCVERGTNIEALIQEKNAEVDVLNVRIIELKEVRASLCEIDDLNCRKEVLQREVVEVTNLERQRNAQYDERQSEVALLSVAIASPLLTNKFFCLAGLRYHSQH